MLDDEDYDDGLDHIEKIEMADYENQVEDQDAVIGLVTRVVFNPFETDLGS